MYRLPYVGGLALIIIVLIVSCQDDQPTSPLQNSLDVSLEISGLENAITAQEGELRAEAFEVRVIDIDSLPAPNVPVGIWVESGPGEVARQADPTNDQGIVEALYYVAVPYGDTTAVVKATAGTDTAHVVVSLSGTPTPQELSLNADDTLSTFYNTPNAADLIAQVVDGRGQGVSGVSVVFTVVSGEVRVGGIVETDEDGIAASQMSVDGTWFGDAVVSASVVQQQETGDSYSAETPLIAFLKTTFLQSDGEVLSAETTIHVRLETSVGLHFLSPDTTLSTFTALDRVTIHARLSDENGVPIPAVPLRFSSDTELIDVPEYAVTDSSGIAETAVRHRGIGGMSSILAEFPPLNLSDEITVEVIDRPPVSVEIEVLDDDPVKWADSTYAVKAKITSEDGNPTVGALANLTSQFGSQEIAPMQANANGIILFEYVPLSGGEEVLLGNVPGFDLISETVEFTVYQEPVRSEDELERVQDIRQQYIYRIRMLDANGNGVPGEVVRFDITLGWVDNQTIVTDMDGSGEIGIFWDGQGSTISVLTVKWRSHTKTVALHFIGWEPTSIDVTASTYETEVGSEVEVEATLRDRYGRFVFLPIPIVFEIIDDNPPDGRNINGIGLVDTVLSVDGLASVTVNTGFRPTPIHLRVSTIGENPVTVMLPEIVVAPGPPDSLSIDFSREGSDAGGGTWLIEMTVDVVDRFGNAVSDGWIVHIDAHTGFTGNSGISGQPHSGTAYLAYDYQSSSTFDTVNVRAYVDFFGRTVSAEKEIVLPLQEGELTLTLDPQHWMFRNETDTATIQVTVILKDGHQISINNAPIRALTAPPGRYFRYRSGDEFIPFPSDTAKRFSGPENDGESPEERALDDDGDGESVVWLIFRYDDLINFPWPVETILVNAWVEGYDDVAADPGFIFITRRPPE